MHVRFVDHLQVNGGKVRLERPCDGVFDGFGGGGHGSDGGDEG